VFWELKSEEVKGNDSKDRLNDGRKRFEGKNWKLGEIETDR
jgi:hypothetical protein